MSGSKEWYELNDPDQLDSPALLVYPDRVKHNIELAIKMAGNAKRLRPHVKTHKTPGAIALQQAAGINKFKCATIAEAEMLGMCKAEDVLLAYQPQGPKLKRFIELVRKYPDTRYACLVDNEATAHAISTVALQNQLQIPVYIDINVGMNRTGIKAGAKAEDLYVICNAMPGISVAGLHAYDGHLHQPAFGDRAKEAEIIYQKVMQLRARIEEQGIAKPKVIIGGSPTFSIYAAKPEQDIEISPGTFIYWDAGYLASFKEQEFLPAVLLLTRVVSLPDETKVCLDLGHKSVGAENPPDRRVRFLNAPALAPVGQSEEHLIVEAGQYHDLKPGDVFYGMPYHVCPTVALYERAITIQDHEITCEWMNIARDRKITV